MSQVERKIKSKTILCKRPSTATAPTTQGKRILPSQPSIKTVHQSLTPGPSGLSKVQSVHKKNKFIKSPSGFKRDCTTIESDGNNVYNVEIHESPMFPLPPGQADDVNEGDQIFYTNAIEQNGEVEETDENSNGAEEEVAESISSEHEAIVTNSIAAADVTDCDSHVAQHIESSCCRACRDEHKLILRKLNELLEIAGNLFKNNSASNSQTTNLNEVINFCHSPRLKRSQSSKIS
ncbi:uncharacterized protein [Prorops nasuta]|uniref:uncharacterized protein n=1 Tax=Prorops nasuta TaxID=863751 RepID=UPI0034CE9A45